MLIIDYECTSHIENFVGQTALRKRKGKVELIKNKFKFAIRKKNRSIK